MAPKTLKWNLGLLNHATKKYLTLETFGFKLNVDGTSLRKKQMWTLEQDEGTQICYFRSHLNRYLSADRKGNVKCEEEERSEETKFTVETQASGKWAVKSVHGAYFGGSGDQLKCEAKISDTELWSIQLAMHPQVNVMSCRRTRYAHLNTKTETIEATEIIPWGADAMLTLEFDANQGKYAFVTSNKMYLNNDGSLHEDPAKKSLFTIEFHEGEVAFRTDKGNYLAAVGTGKIQAGKNTTVGKDELFIIQDSPPQVSFIGQRDRRLSIHQGMDVILSRRDEMEDTEIFQLEFDKASDKAKVAIRGTKGKYWALGDSGVTASADTPGPNCWFELEWHGKQIVFKAHTGKYITGKDNGHLIEGSDDIDPERAFHTVELVNRPMLVLRGEHGFVGVKSGTDKIESNYAKFHVFNVACKNGMYKISTDAGKFWATDDKNSIVLTKDESGAQEFSIELPKYNRMAIRAPNGCYIQGHQNGSFTATGKELGKNALWEY